jgi:predicted transcriptional regulator
MQWDTLYFVEMREFVMSASEKTQISLRLSSEIVDAFDKVAQLLDRDRTWVMQRALKQYLENEGAELLEEAEGLAELDRGEGIDIDDVLTKAEAIISAAEAKRRARAS